MSATTATLLLTHGDARIIERGRGPEIAGTRVVHEHVDPAEARDGVGDEARDIRGARHVGDGRGDGALGGQHRGGAREIGRAAIDQHDPCALGEEQPGGRQAEAAGRAGDDAGLAFQQPHGRSLARTAALGSLSARSALLGNWFAIKLSRDYCLGVLARQGGTTADPDETRIVSWAKPTFAGR